MRYMFFLFYGIIPISLSAHDMLSSLMKCNPRIRHVTICDMEGVVLGAETREGLKPFLNEDEHKEAIVYAINAMKVRQKLVQNWEIINMC